MAAVADVLPALRPEEVLEMDALLALAVIAGRAETIRSAAGAARVEGDRGGGGEGWENLGGGRKRMRITSMDQLRGVLGGGGK